MPRGRATYLHAMNLPVETVTDYPRPPALEPVPHTVACALDGHVVARTDRALRVLETHHAPTYYIPHDDVFAALRRVAGRSLCEWKGQASYFDVAIGDAVALGAAWSYAAPTERFAAIAGHVAFYAAAMDACTVGGVRVAAQPGAFYGGWITPNLRGIVKGGAGTRGW